MKLYRGINAQEFSHFTPEIALVLKNTWRSILETRADGDFRYPEEMNEEILEASRLARLQRQNFTDDKDIAFKYAQAKGGVLIEVDVSIDDIVNNFTIELQKFAQRKKSFEIVYVVDSEILFLSAKKWKLKTINLED